MRPSDTLTGALTLLLGIAVAAAAAGFPAVPGHAIGPGGFPLLIGLALAGSGVVLIRAGWRQRHVSWPAHATDVPSRARRNAVVVVAALAGYALVLETAGFLVAAPLLLSVLLAAFGVAGRWILPLAAGVTLALHGLFYTVLRVPLPWGWLEGIAW